MNYAAVDGTSWVDIIGAAEAITDKDTVKRVQAQLHLLAVGTKNAKLDAGKADGIIGPATRSAVSAFNAAYGWPDDGGDITQGTLEALTRPDVQKLMGTIAFTDGDTVSSNAAVRTAQNAIKNVIAAKEQASTPEQKASAQAAAVAAKQAIDTVAQNASPEVRAALTEVQTVAQLAAAASTPEQTRLAKERANKLQTTQSLATIGAFSVGGGIILGGGIMALLWKSHRALGFLLGSVFLGPLIAAPFILYYAGKKKEIA